MAERLLYGGTIVSQCGQLFTAFCAGAATLSEQLQRETATLSEQLQRETATLSEQLQRETANLSEQLQRETANLSEQLHRETARSRAETFVANTKNLPHSFEFLPEVP